MGLAPIVVPPQCPFCGSLISRPQELTPKKVSEFAMGTCQCGAVYACDVTGHNVGAAMVEAIAFAAGGDAGLMWQLESDRDYVEEIVKNYDYKEHTVAKIRTSQHRAVLIFVKLSDEIGKVFEGKVRDTLSQAVTETPPKERPVTTRFSSKKAVQKLVEENSEDELTEMAGKDTRVLAALQRLLYSPDESFRWRVVDMIGKAAAKVAETRPQEVADFLRRLFWFASDSASTSWGFLEAIGAIISIRADLFSGFIPPLLAFLKDETSRVAALWAVGRICEEHPELLKGLPFFSIFDLLDFPDPLVRGHAVWALGQMKATEALSGLQKLEGDDALITIYLNNRIERKTVGELATEAINRSARPS